MNGASYRTYRLLRGCPVTQGRVVLGRYEVVIVDFEPLVEARRLLRDHVAADMICERLRHDYHLERNEPDTIVAAARALLEYEAQDPDGAADLPTLS